MIHIGVTAPKFGNRLIIIKVVFTDIFPNSQTFQNSAIPQTEVQLHRDNKETSGYINSYTRINTHVKRAVPCTETVSFKNNRRYIKAQYLYLYMPMTLMCLILHLKLKAFFIKNA